MDTSTRLIVLRGKTFECCFPTAILPTSSKFLQILKLFDIFLNFPIDFHSKVKRSLSSHASLDKKNESEFSTV